MWKLVASVFLCVALFSFAGVSSNLAKLLESEPGRAALQRVGSVKMGESSLAQIVMGKELGAAFLKQPSREVAETFLRSLRESKDPTVQNFLREKISSLEASLEGASMRNMATTVSDWARDVVVSQRKLAASQPLPNRRLQALQAGGADAAQPLNTVLAESKDAFLKAGEVSPRVVEAAFATHNALSKPGLELLGRGVSTCARDDGWPARNIETALSITAAAGSVAEGALVLRNIATSLAQRISVSFEEAKGRVCELATRCHFFGPLVVKECVAAR